MARIGMYLVLAVASFGMNAACTEAREPEAGSISSAQCASALPSLWRLTGREYANVVHDWLQVDDLPDSLPSDPKSEGFDNRAEILSVDDLTAQRYAELGQWVAQRAVLPGQACSDDTTADDPCVRQRIEELATTGYRRPALAAEVERLSRVYDSTSGGFHQRIRSVLRGILSSPYFLYRIEARGSGSVNDYEMASRLAFTLWASAPDRELLAAAGAGRLSDPDEIRSAAQRLLRDHRAGRGLWAFIQQYLELDDLASLERDSAEFAALKDAFEQQAERFVGQLVVQDGASFETLLTSRETVLSEQLASHLGLDFSADANEQTIVQPETHAVGILGLPAFLTVHARNSEPSATRRGKFIREKFLCDSIAAPPPGAIMALEIPPDAQTTREKYAMLVENPTCNGCHAKMDRIGFAFERFDELGRYREAQGGQPIDTSAELIDAGDATGEVTSLAELALRLANSQTAKRCFVRHYYRYAVGRAETAADECSLKRLEETLHPESSITQMLLELVVSAAFRARTPEIAA